MIRAYSSRVRTLSLPRWTRISSERNHPAANTANGSNRASLPVTVPVAAGSDSISRRRASAASYVG